MNRFLIALSFLLLTNGAQAQSTFATVVATCGTPPGTYAVGERRPILMDTNGNLCSGTISAGGIGQIQVLDENEDQVDWLTFSTVLVPQENTLPTESWYYVAPNLGYTNTTTAVTIKAADATDRNCISTFQISTDGAIATASEVAIRDGAAGTVIWRSKISLAGWPNGREIEFKPPRCGTAATLMEFVGLTLFATGAVYLNVQGFVTP